MGSAELEKAVEKEYEMALQDRVMEETKEKKNSVEAYVYDMRNKVCWIACFGEVLLICSGVQYLMFSLLVFQLYEKYSDYVTSEDKETLTAKLQEVEDWLYEDGEDETKGVYVAKLEELKKACLLYHVTWIEPSSVF